jgi:NodT family efflux transporter outer membrane factor (OMF) lipoprotein
MDGIGNYDTKFSPNLGPKEQLPLPYTDFAPMLFSSWEINIWSKLKDKKKAALKRMLATEAGRNWLITQLVSEVAAQYYMLLEFDAELEILRRNIILQQNAYDFVLIQKEAGIVNELAVEIIQAQLLSSKEKELEVQQLRLKTEADINQLLGRLPQPIDRDSSIMQASLPPVVRTGVPSDLLKNRMDIQEAELQLQAANADVSAARKAYYPSLNLNGFLGLQSFNAALLLELPASLAYNAAGSLTAPLLNRRQLHSQLIQAGGDKQTAYLHYQKTVVNAFSEVYVSVNQINNIGLRLEQKQLEANVLTKSINTSNELFRTGRANYLELVNSQRNALQAQLELVRLREGQFQSTIQLYRALGGGWR